MTDPHDRTKVLCKSASKESMKKTKLMIRTEAKLTKPLEIALPELINALGIEGTAKILDVSTATIGYWKLKLHITQEYIAIPPLPLKNIPHNGAPFSRPCLWANDYNGWNISDSHRAALHTSCHSQVSLSHPCQCECHKESNNDYQKIQ